MHLKFDNPIFKRIFVFGLMLAVVVYLIVLTVMDFWSSGYGRRDVTLFAAGADFWRWQPHPEVWVLVGVSPRWPCTRCGSSAPRWCRRGSRW